MLRPSDVLERLGERVAELRAWIGMDVHEFRVLAGAVTWMLGALRDDRVDYFFWKNKLAILRPCLSPEEEEALDRVASRSWGVLPDLARDPLGFRKPEGVRPRVPV